MDVVTRNFTEKFAVSRAVGLWGGAAAAAGRRPGRVAGELAEGKPEMRRCVEGG